MGYLIHCPLSNETIFSSNLEGVGVAGCGCGVGVRVRVRVGVRVGG